MLWELDNTSLSPQNWYSVLKESKNSLSTEYQLLLELLEFYYEDQSSLSVQSSGSTSIPKLIPLQRAQIFASAEATLAYFDLKEGDSIALHLPLRFIGGKMMVLRALIGNLSLKANLKIQSSKEKTCLPKVDFYSFTPAQFESYLPYFKHITECKGILLGGGPISGAQLETFKKQAFRITHSYGMSETASHIALSEIHTEATIFTLLPGISMGVSEEGTAWFSGPQTGNLKLQTNDIIEVLSSSKFKIIGRADFTVNSGGVKIQIEEIESNIQHYLLNEHKVSLEFYVSSIPDAHLGEKLVIVFPLNGSEILSKSLLEELKSILPKYKNPKELIFIREFPYTDSGKINRRALKNAILKGERPL